MTGQKRVVLLLMALGLLMILSQAAAQSDEEIRLPIAYGETISYDFSPNERIYFDFEGQAGDVVLATAFSAELDDLYGQIGSAETGWSHTSYSEGPTEGSSGTLVYVAILPEDRVYSMTLGNPTSTEGGSVTMTLERVGNRTAADGRGLSYGDTVGAHMNTDTLQRWWFEGQAGDLVDLHIISPIITGGGVVELRVFAPNGVQISDPTFDDYFVSQSYLRRATMKLPLTGTYYADVVRYPQIGDTEILPFDYIILMQEPIATTLSYGETHSRQLADGVDHAIFSFEASAGETVLVDLQSDNTDQITYRLLNSAAPIFIDGEHSHRWILLESGIYAIDVYNDQGVLGQGGAFDLGITRFSTAEITPIRYGDSLTINLTGTVAPLLRFEGHAGDILSVEVPSEHFISYTAVGGPGLYAEDVSAGPHSGSLLPFLRLPQDGAYYILPHNYHGQSPSGYTIPVLLTQGEAEPTLTYGETVNGTITADSVGIHTFMGSAGDQVSALIEADGFMADLYLFGPGGLVSAGLEQFKSGNFDYIPGVRLSQEGLYTLVVDDFQGGGAGSYTLTLANSPAQNATVLTAGQQIEDVALQPDALHIYQFEVQLGQMFRVDCPFDVTCDLYGPTHSYPGALRMPTVLSVDVSGWYTIVVTTFNAASYDIRLRIGSPNVPEPLNTDGDELPDNLDRCPSESGTLDGCPATESDNDSVIDRMDRDRRGA